MSSDFGTYPCRSVMTVTGQPVDRASIHEELERARADLHVLVATAAPPMPGATGSTPWSIDSCSGTCRAFELASISDLNAADDSLAVGRLSRPSTSDP